MIAQSRWSLALATLFTVGICLHGQDAPPKFPPGKDAPTPPPAHVIAVTVNNQPIAELAIFRALLREQPRDYDTARKEVVNFLIDNVLIDQYLLHLKIAVDAKLVEEKIDQIKGEAVKNKTDLEKVLKTLHLTEEELRRELVCALRWEKFVEQQATDTTLKDMFDKNVTMFDGTRVQARHILVKIEPGTTQEQAIARAAGFKKAVEEQTAQEFAKMPPASQNETERVKILEHVFSEIAGKESSCPSRKNGGALGYFDRSGMVEPFSRTAFALKPYQMSEPVVTEFGCHLILATDRKNGKDVKFEDAKPFVRAVYSDRLREAVVAAMRPRAQIVVSPMASEKPKAP